MNKARLFSRILPLLVLLGLGLWLLIRSKPSAAPPVAIPPTPAANTATSRDKRDAPVPPAPSAPRSVPPPATAAPAILSIGNLLADTSLDNKAVMSGLAKITLDTNRNLAERTEAMSHLLNLSVEDPAPVLLPLVGNPLLPDALCSQILDDSLNDPLSWQADACLAALTSRKGKEIQTKVREHLTFLLDADYGDDLAAWTKAVDEAKAKWAQPAN